MPVIEWSYGVTVRAAGVMLCSCAIHDETRKGTTSPGWSTTRPSFSGVADDPATHGPGAVRPMPRRKKARTSPVPPGRIGYSRWSAAPRPGAAGLT